PAVDASTAKRTPAGSFSANRTLAPKRRTAASALGPLGAAANAWGEIASPLSAARVATGAPAPVPVPVPVPPVEPPTVGPPPGGPPPGGPPPGAGAGTASSNAPMSHAGPCGRVTPRWSVAGQPAPVAGTASMAGLSGSSARVRVGPPFSARGPNSGSTLAPGHVVSGK